MRKIGELSRPDTKTKLLDVARRVFARAGFHGATVQEICERAGANIAAVNYHFRDKLGLYREVVRYAQESAAEARSGHSHVDKLPAERRLQLFIHALLKHLFGEGRPSWFAQVIAHEMAAPTSVLKQLIEDETRPGFEQLKGIVREVVGGQMTPDQVILCANSVVGQCLHYFHSRPVIAELWPELQMSSERIDQIANHITTFSLLALKQIGKFRPRKGRLRPQNRKQRPLSRPAGGRKRGSRTLKTREEK
jgi:AcrR family transcriptional regulator